LQPFVDNLGQGYLFNNNFLTYQLVGANRAAVGIMPINNLGDWGAFIGQTLLNRCLKEISHYLHKTSILETTYIQNSSDNGRLLYPISLQKAIPGVGNIVVGAFSEGYTRLKALFQGSGTINKQFDDAWKEIWDLDCQGSRWSSCFLHPISAPKYFLAKVPASQCSK
jgi:hypothetical protein